MSEMSENDEKKELTDEEAKSASRLRFLKGIEDMERRKLVRRLTEQGMPAFPKEKLEGMTLSELRMLQNDLEELHNSMTRPIVENKVMLKQHKAIMDMTVAIFKHVLKDTPHEQAFDQTIKDIMPSLEEKMKERIDM